MVQGNNRILVVDDNPAICRSLVIFLERQGFDVMAAAEYTRALELVELELFDALIADLDLPGGTGIDLLATARMLRPRMLSILITGYGCTAIRKQAEQLDLTAYLEKPFDGGELLEALRSEPSKRSYSLSSSGSRTS